MHWIFLLKFLISHCSNLQKVGMSHHWCLLSYRSSFLTHHHLYHSATGMMEVSSAIRELDGHHMFHALDSSDVKLMIMGEGLNLDEALMMHYAVENCSR
jgi:regulatory protein NPR1